VATLLHKYLTNKIIEFIMVSMKNIIGKNRYQQTKLEL